MKSKDLAEYNKKYNIFRHHAWAGSVILAIILAVRIFLETTDITINDWVIVIIGGSVVIYTLAAVILTYNYRSGLTSEQKIIEIHTSSDNIKKERIRAEVEKEKLKFEKKKAKVEAKKIKKENK